MLDTCVGGSFCLANAAVGEAALAAETTYGLFRNINQNLPSGISVGYQGVNETPIFCLEGEKDKDSSLGDETICYKDITSIHSILSRFNLNDYKPEPKSSLLHDDDDEEEDVLSLEDIDSLVPGMWLDCRWDRSDEAYYEAMFLTAEQNLQEGLIGVEYDEDRDKKWIPISWCKVAKSSADVNAWQCDVSQDAADSQCDFISYINAGDGPFLRAFKALSEIKKHKQSESSENENDEGKVIFTFTQFEAAVEDEDGYMKMGEPLQPLPAEMKASSYTTIYSHLPFVHPAVNQVDNKFKLYQLYKDDPIASKVFPKSYASYREALLDTKTEREDKSKNNHDDGKLNFFIKDSGATRGEGIYIKTWDELSLDYDKLKAEGEYDVDGGEGDVIIQRAVTDLYTINGDGPIAGRKFDIRCYVLITNGSVYLHSNMMFRWLLGPKYDPNDTNVGHQTVKHYSGGEMARLPLSGVPLRDVNGNEWNNNEKKRRSADPHSYDSARGADAHGWRDAVADALDDASGVFSTLKELTKADPTKYVLAGADAMIKEDGSAVIVEFNFWPDVSYFKSLTRCLAGGGCLRMVMLSEDDSTIDADNYHVTESSPACGIVSFESLAELLRDTASMVMKIQPAHEIEGFREMATRNEQQD